MAAGLRPLECPCLQAFGASCMPMAAGLRRIRNALFETMVRSLKENYSTPIPKIILYKRLFCCIANRQKIFSKEGPVGIGMEILAPML